MTLMDLLLLLLVIAAAVAVYFFFVKSRDEGTETPRKAKNLDGAKRSAKALSAARRFAALHQYQFGLLCVKCVGLGGQIYGNPGDPMWLQVDAEKRISFENPMRAAEADTRLVRDTLFTANLRGIQVETVCVFTNKKATLALPRGTGHYTLKDFKALLGKSKYEQDKGVDIPQTVDAVKKWVVEG